MTPAKKVILSVAMIAGLSVISGLMPAAAHGNGDKSQQHLERMTKRLDLTEQQTRDIKQLISEHNSVVQRPSKEQIKQQHQQHRAQLKAWFDNPTFEEQAVKRRLAKRHAMHQQKMIAKMQLKHAIYQRLNPQQQQKYLAQFDQQMSSMHHGDKYHAKKHSGDH